MPPECHAVRLRPGGDPQREDADHDAAEVSQQMCCIRHDGQTAGGVSTCRVERWRLQTVNRRTCVRELRGEGLCTFYCDFLLNPITNTNQDLFSLSSCLNKRSWASQITTVFQINSLTGFIRLFDPRIVLPFTTLLLSSGSN